MFQTGPSTGSAPTPADHSLDMAWAVYAYNVDAMLEHRDTLATIAAAASEVAQDNRAECEAQRDRLVARLNADLTELGTAVSAAGRRASMVDEGAEHVLGLALAAPSASGAAPLAVEWGDEPRVDAGNLLSAVRSGIRRLDEAVAGVRAAREDSLAAARLDNWRRRRRLGLARDAVVLPLVLGAAAAFFVFLYWGGAAVGPVNATIWTVAAAGVAAGVVAVFRSWILSRLAGDEPGTGSGDVRNAFLLVWGLGLLLYGPAPRPSRYDLEATLLGWLDSALVVAAPLAGLVMWFVVLKDIRRAMGSQSSNAR